MHDAEGHEHRERAALAIWMYCEIEQNLPPLGAVGDDAADERKQEDRNPRQELIECEQKGEWLRR